MTEGKRWRKAIMISLFLHGILLTSLGWVAAKAFTVQETPEQYVELELISEFSGASENFNTTASREIAVQNAHPASAAVTIPRVDVSATMRELAPTVEAVTSSMSVLSAEPLSSSTSAGESVGSTGVIGGTGSTGEGSNSAAGTSGSGKAGKAGGVISPGILSRVNPSYPEEARRAGQEGTVMLKIQILENGRPGHISVYQSSGNSLLDDAAVKAVKQWKFIPAKDRESGTPIVCYTTMPVLFQLHV
ncbi:energy transducer TonB [Pelosinus sp. sgz500959]|uniref:energy transducer TonB n=1 Tax=Pelosinus sp. sgz500959 TaxID=3242472 RepID=UPI00366A894F